MSQEAYVSKIEVKNKHVYIKVVWTQNEEDLFHIQIYDGDCSWSGKFHNEFAQKYKERFENPDEYYNDVKKCLTGEAIFTSQALFSFDLAPVNGDSERATFSWKKRHQGVIQVVGSVPMTRDITAKETIMDYLINKNKNLSQRVTDLENKNITVKKEMEQYKNDLEKFVDMKTTIESTLQSKFIQLINTKKRRIRLLEDSLEHLERIHKL